MIAEATELNFPGVRGDSPAVVCLMAIASYFGVEPHGSGAFENLLDRAEDGDVSPDDIAAAAEDLGMRAKIVAALAPEAIRDILHQGKPILTDLGDGFYVVIHGMSPEGFLAVNPIVGSSVLPLDEPLGWGMVLDVPEAQRHASEHTVQPDPDEHRELAHHYAATWNQLHDQGEMVPHWELQGAHENLAGSDWHVDLGHDGVWRPMHHEDMQRVYLWPRVEKSYSKDSPPPPTVAVDLDGTLAEYDGWKGEDHFGKVRPGAVEALISFRDHGCRIIIFTTRGATDKVRAWLEASHIPFDYINENPDQPPGTSGKVIADLYIDDRAIDARPDWKEVLEEALSRLDEKEAVKKRHGAAVEKAKRQGEVASRLYRPWGAVEKGKRRKPDLSPGLFGQWEDNKQPERKTPHSSEGFEGMHPRRGRGTGGGRFAKINTGNAPGQGQLFGGEWEERNKGGVTIAGEEFERLHPRQPKGPHGGEFAPKDEGTTAHAEQLNKEEASVKDAEEQAESHPKATETREAKLAEARGEEQPAEPAPAETAAPQSPHEEVAPPADTPKPTRYTGYYDSINGKKVVAGTKITPSAETAQKLGIPDIAGKTIRLHAVRAYGKLQWTAQSKGEIFAPTKAEAIQKAAKSPEGLDVVGGDAVISPAESTAKPETKESPSVDKPQAEAQNVTEAPESKEEPHVETPETRGPDEPAGRPGDVSQPERGGDTNGGASGDAGGARPRSAGQRIITARAEHTQTGDPGLVPESVRGHLNEAQQQGAALAIAAMTKHGGFLLSDGTGTGKTRQCLAVAQHFLDQGRKVLYVSPEEVIKPDWKKGVFSSSLADDSVTMGIPTQLHKGEGDLASGKVNVTGYGKLGQFKDKIDKNTVIVFDESHWLKNYASARAKNSLPLMQQAGGVLYASATPGDKPLHIAHLARAGVFGNVGKTQTYQKLGLHLVERRVYGGNTVKVWEIDPRVGSKESARRLSGLFDQMTKDGLMIKRELAMDNVHFQTDRVPLSAEDKATVQRVYQEKLEETRSKSMPNGNKAVALMSARLRQEPLKIPATVDMVKEELAAGRSPIIFCGRVHDVGGDEEEGDEVRDGSFSEGTAPALKAALIAAGVPEDQIGDLHGAATKTPAAKKKAMDNFQAGKTQVMIATLQSGGTGVNLDDTTGERPRTVIVMTPPLTANDMAQGIGRVHRLNTKSESKIRGVLTDTHIDEWNAGILRNKFQTLGAVVGGESTRGQGAIAPPEGLESEEETKQPFVWGESLHQTPKFHANTPYVHNDVIGQFGGKRVNRNGEWTTQFPSEEAYKKYREHVAAKPKPADYQPAGERKPAASEPPAAPMSAARKEAIHQGLRQLHAMNEDRAAERNGMGFNKMDSDFGGQLAEQHTLTDKQAHAAARMLAKYKKQLGDELTTKITTPDNEPAAEPAKPATTEPPVSPTPPVAEQPAAAGHTMPELRERWVKEGVPERSDLAPKISTKRVKTSRGERTVHNFAPGDSFWNARKAGKIPSNVTVRKDPRSGRWEASIWGADGKEIHDTVEALRKAGVRI